MTILYPFGHLIDPDDDAATVLRTFGHLFDGDEGEDPDPEPEPGRRRIIQQLLAGAA